MRKEGFFYQLPSHARAVLMHNAKSLRGEVVIFDPRKLYINIIGKDQIGNAIVRYSEEIIAYIMTYGVEINNMVQKLRAQHPQVDKWEYRVLVL